MVGSIFEHVLSLPASRELGRMLMSAANNLDQDEALQNVGPHLRSKLFDTQFVYLTAKLWLKTL